MKSESTVKKAAAELKALMETAVDLSKDLIEGDGSKFRSEYQQWYTPALSAVRFLMPDRLPEFQRMYHIEKRKQIDYSTYTIEDYLYGVVVRTGLTDAFDNRSAAASKFAIQAYILQSARSRLTSILANIRGLLRADLFDSELDEARDLLKNGHLRAAGAVAGVVLEGHLAQVCDNHSLVIRKKDPHVSDFNDALKKANVFDIPQWRQIQRYADIRNLCDHKKKRDPTPDEVEELIDGVEKAIKTLM